MARKSPTPATIKRLFALSGNTCAHPECSNKMIESDTVVGEVCHIEAANKGARYNANASDDELRDFNNLLLMCERHHKIIDADEEKYTITLLKQWKKEHEEKYANGEFPISDDLVNSTIQKIENLYAVEQKAEKFNVSIIYNEADQTAQVEFPNSKVSNIEDSPIHIENRLNNNKKPSKLFTGREDKLDDLEKSFADNEITTITGIGGFGKTELVLKFIDTLPTDKKEQITWLEFSESTNFDIFIEASGFGVIIKSNKTETEKFSAFIDKINEHQRILVWDNLHDNEDRTFERFLKYADGRLNTARLIIISRTTVGLDTFNNIQLTDFEESFEFAKALKKDRYPNLELPENDLKSICKYVHGHPLAIELAINLCQSVPIKMVIGNLSRHTRSVDELSKRLFKEILEQDDTSQAERDFLYQFSIFREQVSVDAVAAILGDDCFYGTLSELKRKHLIGFQQNHYFTHPLIREFCYPKLDNKESQHAKAASYFINKRNEKLDTLGEERIFYHLKGANNYKEINLTIEKYGRDYVRQAFYAPLQEMIAFVHSKEISTPLHDILIGDIHDIKTEWGKALICFEEAINNETNEELSIEALLKYGYVYLHKNEDSKALEIYEEALKRSKEKGFQKYIAWSYNDIGLIKRSNGQHDEALELHSKALDIRQKLEDNNDIELKDDIATLHGNIGALFAIKEFEKYDLNKAMVYQEKSLEIRLAIGNKVGEAVSYIDIGNIYINQEFDNYNLDKAINYYQKSLRICLSIGDKVQEAIAYNNIGNLYKNTEFGNYDLIKAKHYYEKGLNICISTGDKAGEAASNSILGSIHRNIKFEYYNLNIAVKYYEKSLTIYLETKDQSGASISFFNLGVTLFDQKKYVLALVNFFKSYSIDKKLNIKDDIAQTKDQIFSIKNELGKEKFLKYANAAILKLEPDKQKEIHLSDFENTPIKADKKYNNNDRVKVRYSDGRIVENKYKKIKIALDKGECEIICEEELVND